MSTPIDPFHTMGISRVAHAMKSAGKSVIHMEFGQPSTGAPAAAVAEAHRVLDTDGMGYWESPALKDRIALHYRTAYGLDVSPERILLTCGASPGLVIALSAGFKPGDRIGTARPGYVAYRNAIRALKLHPVEIACGAGTGFHLTANQIAEIDPPLMGMIIASPANPTGAIIPGAELASIADTCRARGVRIISDEIYHGLSYGEPERCMLSVAPDAVVINSFSKYFSMAAWRLGWMVVPDAEAEHYRSYNANLFLTAPSLSQHAALVTMDCEEDLQANMAVYVRNRRIMLDAMPSLGIDAIAPPDGAFYIYADVGHMTDNSLAFCEAMVRETGVAAATGLDFDPVDGRRFVRFSFAVSTAEVEDAITRLKPWFAAQRQAALRAPIVAPG